jgi:hypothetical protein
LAWAERVSLPDRDAALLAADRSIALVGAIGYVQSYFSGSRLEWGDTQAPPVPDDIDEIWCQPAGGPDGRDRWIAVTAVSGTYRAAERCNSWGNRLLAGTRNYLSFAIDRLREHGQDRLADALETEMLASRLVYLELTTTAESMENASVQARQFDISDETLVANMLAAVRDRDPDRADRLRQPLGSGAVDRLVAAYWTQPGWYEKEILARFARDARDRSHVGLRDVFLDLLGIPDAIPGLDRPGDIVREARTMALTWLEGDDDPESFVRLYEDEEAQATGVARYRRGAQARSRP